MIQFKEDEVCRMMNALIYYRDQVTGNEWMWDTYDDLIKKLYQYGEEVSTDSLNCESN